MVERLKKRVKDIFSKTARKSRHLKAELDCNHEWYGDDYTGFFVCPDLLNDQSIVYSFGIGEDISFDEIIIRNHACKVFGFDPTPKSIDWVDKKVISDHFSFYPFGIGPKTEAVDFYLPVNHDYVSGSALKHSSVSTERTIQVQMKSLNDIVSELGHTQIDVLKIDIEGSEYDIIESILEVEVPINQILIEFHDRFFKGEISKSVSYVKMLQENGYKIFAVSDSFEEVSFVREAALT